MSREQLKGDAMKSAMIAGFGLLAGAALVETALVPGLLIGAAVVFLPKTLIGGSRARRRQTQTSARATRGEKRSVAEPRPSTIVAPYATPARHELRQAIFKTITFRIVATSFDFAANMIVIGNFTTAAGLSAFGLVGAPLFYFCHEVFWNRVASDGTNVDVAAIWRGHVGERGLTINRTLAKTITYEVVTTVVDFGANFIATGDVVASAGLTAFAVAITPFLYYGHEKIWDYSRANASSRTVVEAG